MPVVGRVLGHDHQLAHAVGRQLAGFGHDVFHRLGGVLAAHLRNRAERAQPVAAFGDLQKGEVPRRDPQPVAIVQRPRRGRLKHRPLLVQPADQPIGHLGHLLAAEDAHQVVDLGQRLQQLFLLALGQAAGDDHAADVPLALQLEHLVDRGVRLVAGPLDEAAGVDDDEIGAGRLADQLVAVELQQAEHPLAVDQILGAAEADERIGALGRGGRGGAGSFLERSGGQQPVPSLERVLSGKV